MSRILHLSDLHLGEPTSNQWLDEHKGTMAAGDRRAQKHVLRETLEALAATTDPTDIEAVIVSGDLTNHAKAGGFGEFVALVETLKRFVLPERIMVVPGNHDVPQAHGPEDPEARYEQFTKATRSLGLATPLLDGIDFDSEGRLLEEAQNHRHLIHGKRFVLLPINTSHFCWGTEPLPDELVDALLSSRDAELDETAKRLRLHDVPRVSNAQITAITELVSGLDPSHKLSSNDRINVAVLHHQLLPVSSREEFKRFESLTNLGAVREFLASLKIEIVLHGHKHESALYWDYVSNPQSLDTPPSRLLVSAAPGTFLQGRPVARWLNLGQRDAAADVRVEDVISAERRGGSITYGPAATARVWDSPALRADATAQVITGTSASEVYARVQSLFDPLRDDDPLRYLVCEITDPSSAAAIPDDYARDGDVVELQRWMDDLVDWWQLRHPQLGDGVSFNHGERIYSRWVNQVQRAADILTDALKNDPQTTRSAILLLDPQTEPTATADFPSFVSIQLQLVATSSSSWRLDCTGLFRKQEMRYWWPINVAELARVQSDVISAVRTGEKRLSRGVLRTVTAHAIAEERLPVVALPAIDRAVDQRPEDLWRMAYSLLEPEKADAEQMRVTWARYLDDLRPPQAPDKAPPVSRRGLKQILEFIRATNTGTSRPAISTLEQLLGVYRLVGDGRSSDVRELRDQVGALLGTLDDELDVLFQPSIP